MVIRVQPNVISLDERMDLQFGKTVVVRRNGCELLNPTSPVNESFAKRRL